VSPGEYVGRLASARALYRVMVREAIEALPPSPKEGTLLSHASVTALSRRIGVGTSAVRGDLWRLRSHGWISDHIAPRHLGNVHGGEFFLRADMAAMAHTCEMNTVSRLVLVDVLPTSALPGDIVELGPGRQWVDLGGEVLGGGNAT